MNLFHIVGAFKETAILQTPKEQITIMLQNVSVGGLQTYFCSHDPSKLLVAPLAAEVLDQLTSSQESLCDVVWLSVPMLLRVFPIPTQPILSGVYCPILHSCLPQVVFYLRYTCFGWALYCIVSISVHLTITVSFHSVLPSSSNCQQYINSVLPINLTE